MEDRQQNSIGTVQQAADNLVDCIEDQRPTYFDQFVRSIFEVFGEKYETATPNKVFATELPNEIQKFAAVWLLRVMTKSRSAIDIGDIPTLTGSLFDRVFQHEIYSRCNLTVNSQTYEKFGALVDHMSNAIEELEMIAQNFSSKAQLNSIRQQMMQKMNDRSARVYFESLLSKQLIQRENIAGMFRLVNDYYENDGVDPESARDSSVEACDRMAREAEAYGSHDAVNIVGSMSRVLKNAVIADFDETELNRLPRLMVESVDKKYPLMAKASDLIVKVKVSNDGDGPARNVVAEFTEIDNCLTLRDDSVTLGNVRAGESFVFDIRAVVRNPNENARMLVGLSWARLRETAREYFEIAIDAQRDLDWDMVRFEEPYSLVPITSDDELIGRRGEMTALMRLAKLKTVGSGYIYGQKRVGKTSLANALTARLKIDGEGSWVVISKDSGDYVGDDSMSTVNNLGNLLVSALKLNIPSIAQFPNPDFSNGLAPLSGFVDQALNVGKVKLFFILDEFDELPLDLYLRTDLSTSLFLPLRQISNKPGCGMLLVGGEGMQQIMRLQGDRLNTFRPIKVDYFDRDQNWADFVDLIERPVADWFSISQDALHSLFIACGGNPYFAKLIASEMFSDMVEKEHSDVSEFDMDVAIRNTIASVASNSFAHFWNDGLIEDPGTANETRSVRRSVLIAVGRSLRKGMDITADRIWGEFRLHSGLSMPRGRFESTLNEFESRRILKPHGEGNVDVEIPLFRSWLEEKGVGELVADAREIENVNTSLTHEEETRVKDEEIAELIDGWRHFRYQGRSKEASDVKKWLRQAPHVDDQRLLFRILENLEVYDQLRLRSKMHEAFGIVGRGLAKAPRGHARVRRDVLVTTLDESPEKGGWQYCNLFGDENQLAKGSVQSFLWIERSPNRLDSFERLVIIDDFAATGNTIVRGLSEKLDLLKKANRFGLKIIVMAVVGFEAAKRRIENFAKRNVIDLEVHFCDTLETRDQVFSSDSKIFPEEGDRERAKSLVEGIGVRLERRQPLGYGGLGAAVVFEHKCPNNTLPIFWSKDSDWKPLFPRF